MATGDKFDPHGDVNDRFADAPNTTGPDLGSAEKRFGDSLFEDARLTEALRNARPSVISNLASADRTSDRRRGAIEHPKRTDALLGEVIRHPSQPSFPPETSEAGESITGSKVDIYGALNGAPALFHLLQTAPPTPVV